MALVEKPNKIIMAIFAMGRLKSISVDHIQTGDDTDETYWDLVGVNGKKGRFLAKNCRAYICIDPDWISIGGLLERYASQAEAWLRFEAENKEELLEYKRLKIKFGK